MSYEELVDFITNKMSMSHIYQPLLIRTLVESGGLATLRQLAQQFVLQDESQLLFYEQRIKDMPVRVLARHGVLSHERLVVSDESFIAPRSAARILSPVCEGFADAARPRETGAGPAQQTAGHQRHESRTCDHCIF